MKKSQVSDSIRVNNLFVPVSLLDGREHPVFVTVGIATDICGAAETDDLQLSIDCGDLERRIQNSVGSQTYSGLEDVCVQICNLLGPIVKSDLQLSVVPLSAAPLHCKSTRIDFRASVSTDGTWTTEKVIHTIQDLTCPTIVGGLEWERLKKQDAIVTISIETDSKSLSPEHRIDLQNLAGVLYNKITEAQFLTLEALTSFVASNALASLGQSSSVSVAVCKALTTGQSWEVLISRSLEAHTPILESEEHRAAIAIGSNLGDSFHNIEYALRLLEMPHAVLDTLSETSSLTVVNTSFMYETAPMYVTDQPSFINCACVVETTLSPVELLGLLKKIESVVGRVPSVRNGPRAVDLDIVFYDRVILDTRENRYASLEGQLVVPHPLVQEREFVLRPLADMIPDYIHPVFRKSIKTLLSHVLDPDATPMNKVLPWPKSSVSIDVPETLTHWKYPSKTHVMATLNVTPDSFSDGATHNVLPAALAYASSSVEAGATIIDIGGYSTRPGAAFVSVADEIGRVVPAVKALRASGMAVPISVDTFRWEVAEEAIKAGANCINDVYAFSGPDSWPPTIDSEYTDRLKAVARKFSVPVILMHSRGDAGKNKDYSQYAYAPESTLEGVRVELGDKVDRIVLGKGGVRRWLVIVDPGIGFSKSLQGNLEVLRSARSVVSDTMIGNANSERGLYKNPLRGYPQLIGASRKSFLGAILAENPHGRPTLANERVFATAAAVACAVQQGALIVRVHDVQEMIDVVKVADSIWSI